MKRPEAGEHGEYYQGYIDKTRGADFLQNLQDSGDALVRFCENLPEEKRDFAYADGKWTVAQVIRHIIDCDLVFAYRAMWIARTGGGNLQGFEQDDWAVNAGQNLE